MTSLRVYDPTLAHLLLTSQEVKTAKKAPKPSTTTQPQAMSKGATPPKKDGSSLHWPLTFS